MRARRPDGQWQVTSQRRRSPCPPRDGRPFVLPNMLSKAFWAVKSAAASAGKAAARRRRALFLLRLRLRAIWLRTHVDLDVAEDAWIGRRLRVQLEPNSRVRLVLREGVVIE